MTATTSPQPLSPRRSRRSRRLLHNAVILAGAALAAAVILPLLPDDHRSTQDASVVFAYLSFGLLMVTLVIGPRNVLLGRRNPTSTDLRRDVGLWAGITAVAHIVFALQHHFRGNVVRYFFTSGRPSPRAIRLDTFGLGNDLGLAATVVLVGLVAISNDRALRRLGRRWKAWQRANYGLAALVVLHTAVFWREVGRSAVFVLAGVALAGAVVALQLLGMSRVRRGRLTPAGSRTS